MGYGEVTDQEAGNSAVGSIFFPIGLGKTYDLRSVTVLGADADEDYMDPGTEFIKQLDPDASTVTHRYTYVSLAWLKDNIKNWSSHLDAIGWWNYDKTADYEELVSDGDYALKVKDPIIVGVGEAFLGSFDGNGLRFVSNGEVPSTTTEWRDGETQQPFFLNYLPVDINLSDIEVAGDDEEEDYIDPGTEFIKRLNPDDTTVTHRLTYVSLAWLKDNVKNWSSRLDAIGWWNYDKTVDYEELVGDGDYTLKLKTEFPVAAGAAFLGSFDGNNLRFKFPSPLAVPSKAN